VSTALTPRGESTVKANHARPMLAYWLLAIIAAAITGVGLGAGDNQVQVRAGSPSPVSRANAPELLLGGLLHAQPTPAASPGSTVTGVSATSAEHALGKTAVAAPGGSSTKGGNTKDRAPASGPDQTEAVPVSTTRPGKGKGKSGHDSGETARPTTTTTATATSTDTHGKGGGSGKDSTGRGKAH
jgi:hypothetical protein